MNKVVVVLENQCHVTEEIALSTLSLCLFLWTFARSESTSTSSYFSEGNSVSFPERSSV